MPFPTRRSLSPLFSASVVLAALGTLIVSGCKNHDSDTASVRVINALPGNSDLRLAMGSNQTADAIRFNDTPQSFDVGAGSYSVNATAKDAAGADIVLPPLPCTIEAKRRYTVLAWGPPAGAVKKLKAWAEIDSPQEPDGDADIRVINASPDTLKVDIALNTIVSISGLAFGAESRLLPLPAGTFKIAALVSGDGYNPVGTPVVTKLEAGKHYTVVVTGLSADGSVEVRVLRD